MRGADGSFIGEDDAEAAEHLEEHGQEAEGGREGGREGRVSRVWERTRFISLPRLCFLLPSLPPSLPPSVLT